VTASGAQDIGDTGSVEDQFVPCVILCVKLALPPAASLASPRLPVGGPCPRALTYDKRVTHEEPLFSHSATYSHATARTENVASVERDFIFSFSFTRAQRSAAPVAGQRAAGGRTDKKKS
jgi:hypothetical protein